jgi:hypothetical protein
MMPRKPPRSALQIVTEVFEDEGVKGRHLRELASESGVCAKSLMDWKHRFTAPRLDLFIALAEAAGFEVVLRRKT